MNAESAIEKMHSFERFGSRLGLERMNVLLELLGNPQNLLKVIHVAGTNGKGSVCKYIYEILRENGYSAGLYTSPFLEVFNERIELDGNYISDEDLNKFTDEVLAKVEIMVAEGYESPTEFEVITAVAFLYFAKKEPEYVVLEVGLGGSGDSTNVIEKPLVDIITSISFDHMDRLGNTLAAIAGEKAGIIKPKTHVVANVKDKEAAKVIARKAYEQDSVLHDVTKIKYSNLTESRTGYSFDTNIYGTDYSGIEISMKGIHQVENAMTALTAIEILRKDEKIKVERSRLYEGIKKAKQIGRFEILSENPYNIIDGAHNAAGARALADTMKTLFPEEKVLLVAGVLRDKDVDGLLTHFMEIADDFVATEPNNSRKLTADELCDIIKAKGKKCIAMADYKEAVAYAEENRDNYGAVLYAGSLYLIGKVRRMLKNDR